MRSSSQHFSFFTGELLYWLLTFDLNLDLLFGNTGTAELGGWLTPHTLSPQMQFFTAFIDSRVSKFSKATRTATKI